MVDFSRPLELECSFGDVSHLVSECFTLVAPLAQDKKVRLSTRIDPDTHPDVCLDFMRMKQALINILNNAIQASPEGEEVIVECIMKAGKMLINVIDCGDGIPFDKRQEIFLLSIPERKAPDWVSLSLRRSSTPTLAAYKYTTIPTRGSPFRWKFRQTYPLTNPCRGATLEQQDFSPSVHCSPFMI